MRTRTPTVVTSFPSMAKAITPSANALLDYDNKAVSMTIYVGTAGFVEVIPVGHSGANAVIFKVPSGGLVPVEVTHVLAGSTTAQDIVGLF